MLTQLLSLLAVVMSALVPPGPTPPPDSDVWSVFVRIEPLSVTPPEYRCDAIVKSLTTGEQLVVNPVVLSHLRPPTVYIPARDSKGRVCFFTAGLAKRSPIVTWNLSLDQNHRQLLLQSGYVDLRASCTAEQP